jgi:hypothetical protein
MRLPLIALTFCAALVLYAFQAPDAIADHGYAGCGAPAATSCAGAYADYGCHEAASCAGEHRLARRPVRRLIGATLRVATAPVRAVGRLRFVPSRRHGYGCGAPAGCGGY